MSHTAPASEREGMPCSFTLSKKSIPFLIMLISYNTLFARGYETKTS
jgi:hypothetical protein